jgi:hypothetical protein
MLLLFTLHFSTIYIDLMVVTLSRVAMTLASFNVLS